MMAPIIILAVIAGFSTLVFRIILSHRPFRLVNYWTQFIVSSLLGLLLWLGLIVGSYATAFLSGVDGFDVVCGILVYLCALWCNYWVCNLAGGFRMLMMANLADQTDPISLETWMAAFGGLGMDVFLQDRIQSILIPLKIVSIEENKMTLLPGWGLFFARIMAVLQILLYQVRSD
jgi:hypothetical protein